MYIQRKIDSSLIEWMTEKDRKPLLIRGARQIGKTTAIRHLAERFDNFIELNFEFDSEIGKIFESNFDITRICSALEAHVNQRIIPGKTLLFFDEIQVCPRAISSLRYFYEKKPDLHVIATGSLLEFVFEDISDFGVGRIRNMFMHPLSFDEFIMAIGENITLEHAKEAAFSNPLTEPVHRKMLELLKNYLIVGGMPAAVSKFAETRSFIEVQKQHQDILTSLKADFGKYKKRVPAARILEVFRSVLNQTGEKFIYTNSQAGLDNKQSKECITLLEMAKLIYRIDACHGNGVPLGGDVKANFSKFLFLDTGLYLTASELDLSEWILDESTAFVNRGKLAEMFVGLELAKNVSPFNDNPLFYWHREERGSNAEVDYIVQFKNKVLPIEVKSGKRGSMKSLNIMMKEKQLSLGIRTSAENFGTIGNVKIIPLYRIGDYNKLLSE